MASTTTPEYDFDNWTEEDEAKAIAALAPKIQHIIVEKNFIGRFEDGTIVKLPLRISLDDIDKIAEANPEPVDQVKALLKQMGGEDSLADFTRHNLPETTAMAAKFFAVFSRIASATLPES